MVTLYYKKKFRPFVEYNSQIDYPTIEEHINEFLDDCSSWTKSPVELVAIQEENNHLQFHHYDIDDNFELIPNNSFLETKQVLDYVQGNFKN